MRLRSRVLLVGVAVLLSFAPILMQASDVSAAQITTRSLRLEAGASDGGSKPGGTVRHRFSFTVPTTANIGSIKFEYCQIAAGTCDMPVGLSTTAAAITDQSGATGFSMGGPAVNGSPYITRTSASITGATAVSFQLSNIVNPTTAPANHETFFVRITTYTSSDTSGGVTDSGVVTASTNNEIQISGIMPESIIFCTGANISTTSSIPDCSTATPGIIEFNQLFSPTDTATAISKMAASTNAGLGYSITVNGATLTSGANTISAMPTSAIITRGIGQFGLNLVANTTATSTVAVGANISVASNGTDFRGQPTVDYAAPDYFKFVSGDVVANSANAVAGPTNAQIYTVSYIVNVPGNQAAGTYSTTLTYICTPTF